MKRKPNHWDIVMKPRFTVGEEIAGTLAIFAAVGLMLLGLVKLFEIAYG
jgi:hypothetical protein